VLTGLHTFRSTVQEAFPINHFLEIVVFTLAAVNLAQARPRLLVDITACVIFATAALTLESGLLVWVVAVLCWIVGLRGVSTRGLALMTVLLGAYLFARFVMLSVGVPTLSERSSGFLFSVLEPAELQARFGDRRLVFYTYNVVASAMSVLFSEPQAGLFVGVKAWLDGRIPARETLGIASSLVTTTLIAIAAASSLRRYRLADASDRLIIVFFGVLAANAILSFAYVKDDIMSAAGAFYGFAAYAAVRQIAARAPAAGWVAAFMATVLLATSTMWSIRSLGIHHVARTYAFKTRNDWASQRVCGSETDDGRPIPRASASFTSFATMRCRCACRIRDSSRRGWNAYGGTDMSRRALMLASLPVALLALARVVFLILAIWDIHPFWLWEPLNLAEAAGTARSRRSREIAGRGTRSQRDVSGTPRIHPQLRDAAHATRGRTSHQPR
jgi:hypothetical protein